MTKSIIVVKMPCKVLTSWPSLISNVLVAYNLTSDWPRTFFTPEVFLFSLI